MATNLNGTEVVIREEDVKTGGHFAVENFNAPNLAANAITNFDVSFPIPISLLAAYFVNTPSNKDDVGDFIVAPDTTIGTVAVAMATGDTSCTVSQSAADNTAVGYSIKIQGDDLGRVISVDATTRIVTFENAATAAHAVNSQLKQSVYMGRNIEMQEDNRIILGMSKIGGSYLASNTVIRLAYNNKGSVVKNFIYGLEYLY